MDKIKGYWKLAKIAMSYPYKSVCLSDLQNFSKNLLSGNPSWKCIWPHPTLSRDFLASHGYVSKLCMKNGTVTAPLDPIPHSTGKIPSFERIGPRMMHAWIFPNSVLHRKIFFSSLIFPPAWDAWRSSSQDENVKVTKWFPACGDCKAGLASQLAASNSDARRRMRVSWALFAIFH